jgi:integrase
MPRKRKLPEGIRLRNGAYYSDFYAGGRRVRKYLSTDLDAAKEILNELRARADRADFGLLDNDYPLADIREQYLRHCKQTRKPSTVARSEVALNNILPRISASRACQVSHDLAVRYREERLAEGKSPRTINIEVNVLSAMLHWATQPGHQLIGNNPLDGLEPLPHDSPKEGRALSEEEVRRLLDISPPHWRDIWYAFLVTGLRRSELTSLTFNDIDWQGRELIVRGEVAKNHRERRIPIDDGLWDILKRQEAGRKDRKPGKGKTARVTEQIRERFTRDHVFVTVTNTPLDQRSNLYVTFIRWCKKAGIPTKTVNAAGRVVEHVDIHSFRRTFATNLIVGGADPESVRQLLGHSTLEMTMKIYTKIRNQTKRQALGRLSYGKGAAAPEHLVTYPAPETFPVQNGHQSVTSDPERKAN